jgi:orotate phosphoribosyltransferase
MEQSVAGPRPFRSPRTGRLTRPAMLPILSRMSDTIGMTRETLAKRIADVALLRGEFTLRSGRKSNYYLDKYLFETQPDILRELARLYARRIPANVDRLAGPELGAIALAAATAMEAGKPFVIVRNQKKGYGSGKLIEGTLKPGESVVIIEDILTTGGQIVEAAKTLEAAGATVVKMLGAIDRLEGARENIEAAGYSYESLFTTKDLGIA